ncbi:MAG: aminoglycoside phosphotransferase family protein [Acetivibrio sp.]
MEREALNNFQFQGQFMDVRPYGSGHINDTFLVTMKEKKAERHYILQKMNRSIFKSPEELMENIINVTSHLRNKIIERGGNPDRETLNLVLTTEGKKYYIDKQGEYWRAYIFIEDAVSFDLVENPHDFYQSAVAFGHFQRLLSDFPADTLHETIVGFHDTENRFEVFKEVIKKDIMKRAGFVSEEINFVLEREELVHSLCQMRKNGELPLRVTHNDTKLNNIMIDNETGKGICVIDLDTVMPGLTAHDFGDSIRFGASTAPEDEVDLEKVECDLSLFELYTKGFIEGCAGSLTPKELEVLPLGSMTMTFECGMRFLTDYLQGDTYFKIHRPDHNLDRCRTQFKLVSDMESKLNEMKEIVKKYQS